VKLLGGFSDKRTANGANERFLHLQARFWCFLSPLNRFFVATSLIWFLKRCDDGVFYPHPQYFFKSTPSLYKSYVRKLRKNRARTGGTETRRRFDIDW
jgi:hypothetical protein